MSYSAYTFNALMKLARQAARGKGYLRHELRVHKQGATLIVYTQQTDPIHIAL